MIDKREFMRGVARTGLGVAAVGLGMRSAAAQDDAKVAQEVVQYQAMPKDGQQCNKCVNWVEPNACKIVAGVIAPQGYCVAFAPKEGG